MCICLLALSDDAAIQCRYILSSSTPLFSLWFLSRPLGVAPPSHSVAIQKPGAVLGYALSHPRWHAHGPTFTSPSPLQPHRRCPRANLFLQEPRHFDFVQLHHLLLSSTHVTVLLNTVIPIFYVQLFSFLRNHLDKWYLWVWRGIASSITMSVNRPRGSGSWRRESASSENESSPLSQSNPSSWGFVLLSFRNPPPHPPGRLTVDLAHTTGLEASSGSTRKKNTTTKKKLNHVEGDCSHVFQQLPTLEYFCAWRKKDGSCPK